MYRIKVIIDNAHYDSEVFRQLSQCGFVIYWQNIYTGEFNYAIRHGDMYLYRAICIYNEKHYPADAIEMLEGKGLSFELSV